MNLHPWGLWHHDGSPEEGTEEIVATLESVIKRDPNIWRDSLLHPCGRSFELAGACVGWSQPVAAMAPAAGHIVHMPGHVYIRTGDYALR